ncbi:MAG: hypothetical protein ABJZ55_02215 [Fuerstiella sp.]
MNLPSRRRYQTKTNSVLINPMPFRKMAVKERTVHSADVIPTTASFFLELWQGNTNVGIAVSMLDGHQHVSFSTKARQSEKIVLRTALAAGRAGTKGSKFTIQNLKISYNKRLLRR